MRQSDPIRSQAGAGSRGLSRRELLRRAARLTAGVPALLLLEACGQQPPAPAPAKTDSKPGPAEQGSSKPAAPAATAAPAASKPAAGGPTGKITIAQGPELVSIDSTTDTGVVAFNVSHLIMDPLVKRNAKMEYEPLLATSWSFPDPKTIRFKIRQGVTFHDGSPVTAEDVAYTVQRVIDPNLKSLHAIYVRPIAGATVVDQETVDVQLKEPDATLIGRFALIGIVPRKVVEAKGEEAWRVSPVGAGAYRLVEWVKGQRVVLEANMDYWGPKPTIQQVIYRSIPEDNTRMAELRTGGIDIAVNVPPIVAKELKAAPGNVDLAEVRSLRNLFIIINTLKKPFDDVRVRQALNHAIDRQLIVDTIMDGYAHPTSQPYGPAVFGYNPNVKGYEYDVAKAKQLLAAAGQANGFSANIVSASGRYLNDREVVLAVAGQLANVGITLEPRFMEHEQIMSSYARTYTEDQDLRLFSNANNTADADYNLSLNFHSGNRSLYWKNPETDRLIDQARAEPDRAKREALYHEITAKLVEAAPAVFLYDQVDVYGVSKRVQGWSPRPDEMIDLVGVTVTG